jgi:hypothetical protein
MSAMFDFLPSGLFERIQKMKRIGKSTVKIQPLNNGSVNSTQSITFQLPNDAILDLSTLEFSAVVKTPHNGAIINSPQYYYQGRYLPRNGLASLISSIDIQINGKSISNIVGYSYLYNLIKDWVLGKDLSNRVGELRDPSSFFCHDGGKIVPIRGFPIVKYTGTAATDDKFLRFQQRYYCRDFIGFLNESSQTVINTAMLGTVQIQIWLESPAVLILGSKPSTALAATNSTTNSSLQINRAAGVIPQRANSMEGWLDLVNGAGLQLMTAPAAAAATTTTLSNFLIDQQRFMRMGQNWTMGDTGITIDGNVKIGGLNNGDLGDLNNVNAAAVVAETNVYTLSDIYFTITRYQFYESTYYDIVNKVFSDGRTFNIHFKNYDMFTGPSTTSRTQTHRITTASECVNWVVNTFQLNDRETQQQIVNTLISPQAAGELGVYQATIDSQIASALPRTFNNAVYFVRNGSKIRNSYYKIDGDPMGNGAPREPWEVYKDNILFWEGETKGINKQYEGCQSLYHFIETFYNDILSFQYNRDKTIQDGEMLLSGYNCTQSGPITIEWSTVEDTTEYTNVNQLISADSDNIKGFSGVDLKTRINAACTPVAYVCYTSRLEIGANRNINLYK